MIAHPKRSRKSQPKPSTAQERRAAIPVYTTPCWDGTPPIGVADSFEAVAALFPAKKPPLFMCKYCDDAVLLALSVLETLDTLPLSLEQRMLICHCFRLKAEKLIGETGPLSEAARGYLDESLEDARRYIARMPEKLVPHYDVTIVSTRSDHTDAP